jgi:hypothetical protein
MAPTELTDKDRLDRTEELFRNPAFEEAFATMREGMVREMVACDPKDDMGRYRYAVAVKVLDWTLGRLKGVMVAGKIEAEVEALHSKRPWWSLPAAEREFAKF